MTDESRRRWLKRVIALASVTVLSACDRLKENLGLFPNSEKLTQGIQRLLMGPRALAPEYTEAAVSAKFRPNGSTDPQSPEYLAHSNAGFADWRLILDGLVERPLQLSLAELRIESSRTQITRHDCVEGWSAIAKWKGARLGPLLEKAGLKPGARFVVFHCADELEVTADGSGRYYESIDLMDAFHPQTILAYDMNGFPLPVAHGAPIRLRLERQLGYKHAKYVMRIEVVADYSHIGAGKGGYWEDRGYEWYAGI